MSTLWRNTWHHLRRSPFQSLAVIIILFVNFLAASAFAYLSFSFSSLLKYIESVPEITVFFKEGITAQTVQSLRANLETLPGVREIRYISPEEAFQRYQEENKDNPLLLELVTAESLPASLEIAAINPQELEKIAQTISSQKEEIDQLIYQKDAIDALTRWTKIIRLGGIATLSILSFISFIAVFIIIGLKIVNRKEEIGTLRLLGASSWYVKQPYLLEGAFYGFFGSLGGWATTSALLIHYRDFINKQLSSISPLPPNPSFYLEILAGCLLAGVFLGVLASFVSARRQLKY